MNPSPTVHYRTRENFQIRCVTRSAVKNIILNQRSFQNTNLFLESFFRIVLQGSGLRFDVKRMCVMVHDPIAYNRLIKVTL